MGAFVFFQMNQQCKVCGEPAAGFHFGAFTCEGCKVGIKNLLMQGFRRVILGSIGLCGMQ